MQMLIEIREEDFTLIRSVNNLDLLLLTESRIMSAVKNGTPLDEIIARLAYDDPAEDYEYGYNDALRNVAQFI